MVIYDIFGAAPQTLQGADLLAAALEPLNTVIIVPDLFNGDAAQEDWLKPDASEESKAAKTAFQERAYTFGLCWGGKLVAGTSREGSPWTVSGQVHPGLDLTKEDAENIVISHFVLASNGEDAKVVQEYKNILEARDGFVETYSTMHHGWMGSRANRISNVQLLSEHLGK